MLLHWTVLHSGFWLEGWTGHRGGCGAVTRVNKSDAPMIRDDYSEKTVFLSFITSCVPFTCSYYMTAEIRSFKYNCPLPSLVFWADSGTFPRIERASLDGHAGDLSHPEPSCHFAGLVGLHLTVKLQQFICRSKGDRGIHGKQGGSFVVFMENLAITHLINGKTD